MKKILLVGCEYFPLSVPCSFRLHAFARHLPEFGYEPQILAIRWDDTNADGSYWSADCLDPDFPADPCLVTRFYYRFPRRGRIRNVLRQHTTQGLCPISWPLPLTRMLVHHMERLHERHGFDAVLTTVPYYQPLQAGHSVHAKHGVPWIVDFRDIKGELPLRPPWNKPWRWLSPAYEKWAIACQDRLARGATAAVTVSEPLAEALMAQGIPQASVIYNGFSPEEFPAPRAQVGDKFEVVYAGTVIPGSRDPAPLLDGLDLLCQSGKIGGGDFSLVFYGEKEGKIRSLVAGRRCADLVLVHSRLGKRAIHEVMGRAGILLHLSTPGARGIMTSKLTEYLGAGRPILTVPGDHDVVDQVLERTGVGVSLRDPPAIAGWVLDQYEYWRIYRRYMPLDSVKSEVEKYTWREQVKRLAGVLDDACVLQGQRTRGRRATSKRASRLQVGSAD